MNFLFPTFISLVCLSCISGSFIRSTSFSSVSSEETTEGPKRISHGRNSTTISPLDLNNGTTIRNGSSIGNNSTNCSCTFPARLAYCGTDGITYDSACKFRCASRINPDLKLAKRGPCEGSGSSSISDESSEPPHHVFSFFTNLFHKNNNNNTVGEKSHNIRNETSVKISATSTSDETVEVSTLGSIRSSTAKNSPVEHDHFLIEKRESGKQKENCICTFNYAPVCGVDGHLYGNECELNCHNVTRKYPESDKAHRGKC